MYQQNEKIDLSYLPNPEEDFRDLVDKWKECVKLPEGILDKDNSKWDLNRYYIPVHACIWNKPANIGKKCIIVQKDNEVASVLFKDDAKMSQDKFYRLRDLERV
jgi:hypothetical protein